MDRLESSASFDSPVRQAHRLLRMSGLWVGWLASGRAGEAVLAHLFDEGRALERKQAGGIGHHPFRHAKRLADVAIFEIADHLAKVDRLLAERRFVPVEQAAVAEPVGRL